MNYALVGAPGSGKSSIADALGVRMSFADGVKREVANVLGPITQDQIGRTMGVPPEFWPTAQKNADAIFEDMHNPAIKDVYRELLQLWGTELRRAQDVDYWVKTLIAQVDRSTAEDASRVHVVDDCRFPNEYAALRQRGFKFVRLEAGANTRPLTGTQAAHASEQYWPLFNVDLVLDYQQGAGVQAQRIIQHFEGTSK